MVRKLLSQEEKLFFAIFGEQVESYPLLKSEIEGVTLRQALDTAIDTIPREIHRKVIRMRFGFDDGRSKTLIEVGTVFGVTRERIRQIEAQTLRRLRHPSRSRKLKEYFREV